MKFLTVKKLHDDLDYWVHIGTGDDIVRAPDNRKEYGHLVAHVKELYKDVESFVDAKGKEITREDFIAKKVLAMLKDELKNPWFVRPTFYRLLWLYIKGLFSGL